MENNFNLKNFLTENKLTPLSKQPNEQENSSNKDFKRIEKWYYRSNPEADELSPEQEEDGIKAHFEEWNSVKDQYKSIEQYFQDVERQGDWYSDKALSEQENTVTSLNKQLNEEERNNQIPAENMEISAALAKAGIQPADQVEFKAAEGLDSRIDGVYKYEDAIKELEELIQQYSVTNTPIWDFSAGEWSEEYPLSLQAPEEEDILIKKAEENRATSSSEKLNEGRGDLEDIIEIIKSRSAETGFSEVAEAEEIIRDIKDYYGI